MPGKLKPSICIGDTFGRWIVEDDNIECVTKETDDRSIHTYWVKCKCECGKLSKVKFNLLRDGKSSQCSSCNKKKAAANNRDLIYLGQKFNDWEIIDDKYYIEDNRHALVMCRCCCGKEAKIEYRNLKSNKTKSCHKCASTIHGLQGTRIYHVWENLKQRCLNPNKTSYQDYGGRGIILYDPWANSFIEFYNWAMENGYKEDLELDRIDVNGNYHPDNTRFVTRQQNITNRRSYKGSSSKYKGVTKRKSDGKFIATITKDYKCIYLGTFENENDAALAYNEAAKETHEEFALLNKIDFGDTND